MNVFAQENYMIFDESEGVVFCAELYSSKFHVLKSQTLAPQNVTVLGYWAFTKVIKVKCGY